MEAIRRSGILLHPTSLPGSYGIGTLGQTAYKFIDWLKSAGQTLWQVLPLGPTGYGDSPYASFSTFAGNPLLIDLDLLVENGWAKKSDIKPEENLKKEGIIDYGQVIAWKTCALNNSADYFLQNADSESLKEFINFCSNNKNWLDNFATFMAIKSEYGMWNKDWPLELAKHNLDAIKEWQNDNAIVVERYKVIQFFFESQWKNLKKYANENGIKIIGDIPIFVALDSADVWANQKYFQIDEELNLKAVAGVPPDYFSATGQLWGNPLYDWDVLKENKFDWWIERIKRVNELTDIIRIDHFRGFEAYWSVPSGESTAINGEWKKGPGIEFFNVLKKKLGNINVIAEDLGIITDEVRDLRNKTGFPGMKVLQFAFSPAEIKAKGMTNEFMPHQFSSNNCVVYTGTHDNDTLQGWLLNCDNEQLKIVAQYAAGEALSDSKCKKLLESGELVKKLIRLALSSCAVYSIFPMQDILGLDNSARMNMPSTMGCNWAWRMESKALTLKLAQELAFSTNLYGRK